MLGGRTLTVTIRRQHVFTLLDCPVICGSSPSCLWCGVVVVVYVAFVF